MSTSAVMLCRQNGALQKKRLKLNFLRTVKNLRPDRSKLDDKCILFVPVGERSFMIMASSARALRADYVLSKTE